MAEAIASAAPPGTRAREVPLSDGGHGLLDACAAREPALERGSVRVAGPLGARVSAAFLARPGHAVVESAEACGLHLVPPARRDPLAASTAGLGALLWAAIDAARAGNRPPSLLLGLGGSATVDGGCGMAAALGWRLLDAAGAPIPPGGRGLTELRRIAPPDRADRGRGAAEVADLNGVRIEALADVRTPLTGPLGAAAVFAPQKGADAAAVELLEEGLANLARRLSADLGVDAERLPGAGAAGGLGAGAVAFLGARLVPGAERVLEAVAFDAHLARALAVVTGEGSYDDQSHAGKVVGVVVERAVAAGVPVVVVAGRAAAAARPGVVLRSGGGAKLGHAELAELAADGLAEALRRGRGEPSGPAPQGSPP